MEAQHGTRRTAGPLVLVLSSPRDSLCWWELLRPPGSLPSSLAERVPAFLWLPSPALRPLAQPLHLDHGAADKEWLWKCSHPGYTLTAWWELGPGEVTFTGHQLGPSPTMCISPRQTEEFVAFCHFHVGKPRL